jgi:undecaprenyl-diphosphatase
MSWNTDLFLLLNAPAVPGPTMLAAVRMLAESPVVVAPGLLVWLWVRRPDAGRAGLLAAALAVLFGQLINGGLGLLWFEPRPFMAGIGHTLLVHAPNNGFPSDHMTMTVALGAALVLTGVARTAGIAVCVLGLGVGWARVWLGVHFPVDVLTGIPAGGVAAWLAWRLQPALGRHVLPPAELFYEAVVVVLRLPRTVFPRARR